MSTETTPTPAKKETKAQKSERLKLEKNPWQAWEDVRNFAKQGIDSVAPDWAHFYFKWWGIYTQGDGIGAVGGVGREREPGVADQRNGLVDAYCAVLAQGRREQLRPGVGPSVLRG